MAVVSAKPEVRNRIRILPFSEGLGLPDDVSEAVELWASLARAACRRRPQLIVTPELVIRGKDHDGRAVQVPGPATAPFERIADDHNVHVVIGMQERHGDAVHNSAVLFAPRKGVQGVYRKVRRPHLYGIYSDQYCLGPLRPGMGVKNASRTAALGPHQASPAPDAFAGAMSLGDATSPIDTTAPPVV